VPISVPYSAFNKKLPQGKIAPINKPSAAFIEVVHVEATKKLDLKAFGKEVQKLREGMGVTRAEMAEAVGVSHKHLQLIERNGKAPSLHVFVEIVTYLGISVDRFLYPDRKDEPVDKARRRINRLVCKMDGSEAKIALALLKALHSELRGNGATVEPTPET